MQKPKSIIETRKPERIIQDNLITFLRDKKGWLVEETHGNAYQNGFPDLYCAHRSFGTRWIEVKNPLSYSFTPAQQEKFPKFTRAGVGIWILVAATEEEYAKLFQPANWYQYLKWSRI